MNKLKIEVRHDGRYFWMTSPELGEVFSSAETYRDTFVEFVRCVFENKSRLQDLFTPVYTFGFSRN
ncbi:MAG: hypothetical protein HYT72_02995 [Candidatus Aenigmarchaeota archaeon]|nr:hypothetical protein [Candidatus Aenigmarchaeota archaeon]